MTRSDACYLWPWLAEDAFVLITPPVIGSAEYCDELVCLSVCLCLPVRDHNFGTTRPIFIEFFLCVLSMVVARSSSDGVMIRYAFQVLWMTSYLHINT